MKTYTESRIISYFLTAIILFIILSFLSCKPPTYEVDTSIYIKKIESHMDYWIRLFDSYGFDKVGDVVISVNETIIPCTGSDDNGATYVLNFGPDISDGDPINIIMTGGDVIVDQTTVMPHQTGTPSLLNPSPLDASQPQPVTWEPVTPAPPRILVIVWYNEPGESYGYGNRYLLPGTASTFTIPADSIPGGTTGRVEVYSYNTGQVEGESISSESYFEVKNNNNVSADFTTQQSV